jgi:hypothetical protein
MGNFYSNITIKDKRQTEIAQYLANRGYSTAVAPPLGAFIVIFVELSISQRTKDIAIFLSGKLGAPALAIGNADDDLLELDLYDSGKLCASLDIGSYNDAMVLPRPLRWLVDGIVYIVKSRRRRFVTPQVMAAELGELMRPEVDRNALENLLTATGYTYETDRHRAIVELLELPDTAVATGYEYLRQGEWPSGLDSERTVWTP